MPENVKGFIVQKDFYRGISMLSDEQRGKLFMALFADAGEGEMPELDAITNVVFQMMLPSVHAAQESYDRRKDTSKTNGKLGGRPKKDNEIDENEKPKKPNSDLGFDEEPNNLTVFSEKPKNQNRIEENRKERINTPPPPPHGGDASGVAGECSSGVMPQSGQARESRKRFMPPKASEVEAYCLERGNGIDPVAFVDFYEAKGWCVGKTPMKDWKAAIRTWEHERREKRAMQEQAYAMPLN